MHSFALFTMPVFLAMYLSCQHHPSPFSSPNQSSVLHNPLSLTLYVDLKESLFLSLSLALTPSLSLSPSPSSCSLSKFCGGKNVPTNELSGWRKISREDYYRQILREQPGEQLLVKLELLVVLLFGAPNAIVAGFPCGLIPL